MWQKILTRILTCTLLCGLTLGSSAAQRERSDSAVVRMARAEGLAFSADNSLILLPTGREKFTDLFQSIRLARHSIHLEYFNFRNDSISGELFSLLIDRARHGVKVRIIFDGFGNSSNNRPLRRRHLEALREAGLEVFEFDPMRFPWINHAFNRDHRKIAVIDGMIGYTGGMNVADYYITGKPEFGEWRDMHCRVTGTAAWDLQDVFLNMWNRPFRAGPGRSGILCLNLRSRQPARLPQARHHPHPRPQAHCHRQPRGAHLTPHYPPHVCACH